MAERNMKRLSWITYGLIVTILIIAYVLWHRSGTSSVPPTQQTPDLTQSSACEFARRLTITYQDGNKIVTVKRPWRGATKDFTYLLYPRTSPKPPRGSADLVVAIPLDRVVLTSTTSAPYFVKLGITNTVVGITNPELVNTPEFVERITSGHITTIGGSNGTTADFNVEKLVALKPDLVIAHSVGSVSHDVYPKIRRAGIRTVLNASYMEETPLGRTEWIRFYAAFFNKEKEAETIFTEIKSKYNELKELARSAKKRPRVLCNIAYKGTWYLPGGKSYIAKFLEDAGAAYPWADDTNSGGVPTDLEVILAKAGNADLWLNPGLCRSLNDILRIDPRYREFSALKRGQVYNHTKKINGAGGMDYWESGSANPDLMLADLISLFHPTLLPDHQSIWFEKLPEERNGSQ